MKFKKLVEETLYIVQVYDKNTKRTEYIQSLLRGILGISPLPKDAMPMTKEDWEKSALKEKLERKTYRVNGWDKPLYQFKFIKYIPNMDDLVKVYCKPRKFTLADIRKAFKEAGIKIILDGKDSYYLPYGEGLETFCILYVSHAQLEETINLVQKLVKQVDIGFAYPDRRTSCASKKTP